jgi:hypothetical protein
MNDSLFCAVHLSDYALSRYCEAALEIGPSEDGRCRFHTLTRKDTDDAT